jgi:nucleotide-binding universal stress UspA family protein
MHDKHLLVPLDGTPFAESALPVARVLANALGADITVCLVLPGAHAPSSTREPLDYLQRVATEQQDLGVESHTSFQVGDPASQILELVRDAGFDLAVMATHSRTAPARGLLGSVADQVLHSSPVPVVLLYPDHRETTQLRTVLVPLDGSPGSAVALSAALPLARSTGARVVLVRVSVPQPVWFRDPTLGTGHLIDPMWAEDARSAAEAYVVGMAGRIQQSGVAAQGVAVSARAADGIIQAANEVDADLIVMSSHVRGGPLRTMLGSVADDVIRKSRRPVLVMRRSVRESPFRTMNKASGSAEGRSVSC